MNVQFHWVLLPLLVTTLFCLGTACYLGREAFRTDSKRTLSQANKAQSAVLLALAVQAFGQVLVVSGTTEPVMVAGMYLTVLTSMWAALSWFVFATLYTGREHWLTRRTVALLAAGVLVGTVLTLTDPFHGRVLVGTGVDRVETEWVLRYELGLGAWYAGSYTWLVSAVAIWLLFQKFLTSRNVYRKIAFFHVVGGTSLNLAMLVASLGLGPVRYLALGPAMFALVIVVVAPTVVSQRYLRLIPVDRLFGVLGSRFRNLSPMARDTIIETMQNGILVLDHDNRIVDLNPMGRRMIGATDRRVVGKPLQTVTPASTFLTDETGFLDPTTTDAEFRGVWVEADDEERRCFDLTITGLGPADDPAGRVALINDVTDRERRKGMLRRRTEELERQNEQLDQFAGVVSHDLRNPLNVARGYLETVDGNEDAVAEVDHSLGRMEAIIDDVLTLAREDRTLGETEQVTLDSLAREACGDVATGDAELVVDDSASFEADPDRLLSLFENLFRNARDHAGPSVTVTVGTTETGFYVADDGPGIPESERDSVLEFGYTTTDSGTGFGLAIVTQVAHAHGWNVDVTESENGGGRFEFGNIVESEVEAFGVSTSLGE
ncbi:histidine kinase N-terminal 7TM domain-containing protein [Haloarchaeobius litoreus]|uniref:histidine kinase n=1 Tax=Haloarchaeobius litoreus TaxID=755306 RepID=A0ABD6DF79_9EURY|nr:histidine kinase N-terminal 7TM domain-containing protein [Haloarchaeobius litoreus]